MLGTPQSLDRLILPLIAVATLLRVILAVATPAFEAPDEYPHYWVAAEIARTATLPTSRPEWPAYEAFQPPLYYAIAAALIAGGEVVGLQAVRDASFEEIDHLDVLPGSLLLLRLFSVLCGLLILIITRRLLLRLELSPLATFSALGFVALLPTFIGTSSSVNNDTLAVLFAAVSLLFLLPSDRSRRDLLLGGLFLGLTLATKLSGVVLVPTIGLILGRAAVTGEGIRPRLHRLLLVALGALPATLLLVIRNLTEYGSLTATMPGVETAWSFGAENILRAARNLFWSFWFAFGRLYEIQLPALLYLLLFLPLSLLPLAALRRRRNLPIPPSTLVISIVAAIVISLLFTLSWPSGTMTSWGKNLYPLLPVIGLLFGYADLTGDREA